MNEALKKSERIEFIDLAKGICILLVVAVHVIPELDGPLEFLACLRMPLYFCLSGLFYKDYGSLKNLTIKKLNKLLIPFVSWYLIGYTIYYICRILINSQSDATYNIKDILVANDIFNLPIWFLLCLFWSNLLFFLINFFAKKWYHQLEGVVIVGAIGYCMSLSGIFNLLYIGSAMTCMPFFYLGYVLKKTVLLYPSSNRLKDFVVMSGCLIAAFLIILTPEHPPRIVYYSNIVKSGNPVQVYVGAALFVVGVLLLCKLIRHIPYVSWLGRYSVIILVTHMWLKDITGRLLMRYWTGVDIIILEALNLLIIVALMGVVIPICKKWFPYITAQKDVIKSHC